MAVNSVLDGTCSLLMKGDIKTSILLKSVLANSKNSKKNRLSHIAVMETPKYDRLMLWTDGGVNVNLNKTIITSIIHNALKITKELKIHHPNIAMLALVEKRVSQLPETVLADEICKCFSNDLSITVEGPISLDVALSKYAANQKRIKSLIAGKTDVFVGPSITTINLIVKALLGLGQAKVGGIVLGWRVPIVLLSRSDDSTTRLNSIALGAFLTKRK
jgi:phosphate butyryltransferase